MARDFDGSTDYLSNASAPVTAVPLSMTGLCYKTSEAANGVILSIGNASTVAEFALAYTGNEDAQVRVESVITGTTGTTASTGAGNINEWTHCAAVWSANNARSAFRAGGNKGSSTTSNTPLLVDNMTIARQANSDVANFFPGRLAEIALYNIALADADAADASDGFVAPYIRSDGITAYWPIFGNSSPEPDFFGRYDMTLNASPDKIADHPRIIPLRRPALIIPAAVVPGHPAWKRWGGVPFMGGPRAPEGARVW